MQIWVYLYVKWCSKKWVLIIGSDGWNNQEVLRVSQKKKLIQHSRFLFSLIFSLIFSKSTSFAKVVSVSALTDAAIRSKMFNFEIYIESYAHTLG